MITEFIRGCVLVATIQVHVGTGPLCVEGFLNLSLWLEGLLLHNPQNLVVVAVCMKSNAIVSVTPGYHMLVFFNLVSRVLPVSPTLYVLLSTFTRDFIHVYHTFDLFYWGGCS